MFAVIKPRPLRPGDAVGIVAPAGAVAPEPFLRGLSLVERWGFRPVTGSHLMARHGYLAGTDEQRAADLNGMLADPAIRAIWFARGGYGVMRLLRRLNWDALRRDPKLIIGFSDITALHTACWREVGLVTFHGPMAEVHDPAGEMPAYNAEGLLRALTGRWGPGPIPLPQEADAPALVAVAPGRAQGRLLGGNLELLTRMAGTPWQPDTRGALLVLEEVDEAPYRIDRMLVHLQLAGMLDGVAGIIFGHSPSCEEGPEGRPSLTLMEVLHELLGPLGVPVLYGFPCGHSRYRATLPLGVMAELDADAGRLSLLEHATAPE